MPRSFEPGSAYKDGKLYLFSEQGVLVVCAWPDPRAWRLGLDGPWKGARPLDLNLAAPDRLRSSSSRRLRCQAQAFEAIPTAQRRAAVRFGVRAWPLHVLFSRVPGTLGLAERCPALAAGLALANSLRSPVRQPLRSARALLRDPGPRTARRVAEWLGFEPSRAMVRVLGMLAPQDCSVGTLRLLREAMADPVLRKVLLHAPRLEKPLFRVLWERAGSHFQLQFGSALLAAVASAKRERAWRIVGSLYTLDAAWRDLWPDRAAPRVLSLGHLNRLNEQATEQLKSSAYLNRLAAAYGGFSEPPLAGGLVAGFRIEPLRSVEEMILEGQRMGHCIGSKDYVRDCAMRRGFGYRVVQVDAAGKERGGWRATAWIDLCGPGKWSLGDLRTSGNGEVDAIVQAAVERWLALRHESSVPQRPSVPEAARGRTLRVVRHHRQAHPRRPQPPRPPPALGRQLPLGFEVPF